MGDFKDKIRRIMDDVKKSPIEEAKEWQTRNNFNPVLRTAQERKERMAAASQIEREKANEAILHAIELAEDGVSSALIVPDMKGVFYLKKLFSSTKEVQTLEVTKHRDDGVELSNNTTIRFMPRATESNASLILSRDAENKKREYKILDVNSFEGDPDMDVFAEVFGWE